MALRSSGSSGGSSSREERADLDHPLRERLSTRRAQRLDAFHPVQVRDPEIPGDQLRVAPGQQPQHEMDVEHRRRDTVHTVPVDLRFDAAPDCRQKVLVIGLRKQGVELGSGHSGVSLAGRE